MSDHDIFATRRIPLAGIELLEAAGVGYAIGEEDEEQAPTREALLAGLSSCRVLLCQLTERIDREVLEHAGLLGVANMAVGFNNIDVEAATELGVPVTNTPGVLTDTTADLTWALILAVARRIPEASNYLHAGRYRIWGPNLLLGSDVGPGPSNRRKVLGIIGFGRIGAAVARRAGGFDMEVLAYDPRNGDRIAASGLATRVDLPELLSRSDFVTLHTPLDPETHHLIGAAELQAMKPTAFLINSARGPIVDEAALVAALAARAIAGAGLDVYEREPKLAPGLTDLPNVVLLPHIGSATHETRGRMAAMAAENAIAHLRRERAPNAVNPEVYETEAYRRRRSS